MAAPPLKPFWICLRGGTVRIYRAHHAIATDTDLVLANTLLDRPARTIVGHFPIEMIEAWGEGSPPDGTPYEN
jgi:hypothetical protein